MWKYNGEEPNRGTNGWRMTNKNFGTDPNNHSRRTEPSSTNTELWQLGRELAAYNNQTNDYEDVNEGRKVYNFVAVAPHTQQLQKLTASLRQN